MKIVIDATAIKMRTATREALLDYLADNGISWAWQQEALPTPTLECLTLDPSRLNPADLERFRAAFANPVASCFSTATGADLDALVARSGYIEPRKEGETDEVFRQRALHTHNIDVKPMRHVARSIGFDPALCAPYGTSRYGKEAPRDIYTATAEQVLAQSKPYNYQHCPFCNTLAEYTHRDGLPVCKCPVKTCKGHERWLEYGDFADLPEAWKPHYGGPCPVRHDEVEVELRGDFKPGADLETRSVKRRGMPEAFNWHWGRPGTPTTRIDVLNWRRVKG